MKWAFGHFQFSGDGDMAKFEPDKTLQSNQIRSKFLVDAVSILS